jgi:hypothetical protein
MKIRLVAVALLAAMAWAVAAHAAPLRTASTSKRYLTSDCVRPHFRPHRIILACGDGNFYINHISWDDWDGKVSHGKGTARQNDCDPSCAGGQFHSYPAKVRASKVRDCQGKRTYMRLRWTYTGSRPSGAPKSSAAELVPFDGC